MFRTVRRIAATLLLMSLTACGTTNGLVSAARTSTATQAEAAAAGGNIFFSDDIRYVCERVIKLQTKAKANKTNVAHMETALYHVQTLAKQQKLPAVEAIAKKALANQHKISQAHPTVLPTAIAEALKAGCLKAFAACLAELPAAPKKGRSEDLTETDDAN